MRSIEATLTIRSSCFGAADEFVLPARLALDVQDAALGSDSTFTRRVTALLARFLRPEADRSRIASLRACGAGVEKHEFHFGFRRRGVKVISCVARTLLPSRTDSMDFCPAYPRW